MEHKKVLIVGGTGYFGLLLVDDLLRHSDCDLVVASRRPFCSERFETIVADLRNPASLERALTGVSVAICAAGPFQELPTSLAEMCIERGIHYIDLADDRGFVQRVRALGDAKRDAVAAICPGWSTVSALSGLLAQIASDGMKTIDSIYVHMAPGNRGARHTATIASLLHSVGRPFTVFRNGVWHSVIGWSEPREFDFPLPVGTRRGYLVDVSDHELFPQCFALRTVEFRAGAEFSLLNGCLSLLQRTGWSWVKWSPAFQRLAAFLSWMGHDWGAVGVEVRGSARRRASIIAGSSGGRIAAMPASIMTRSLLAGASHHGLVLPTTWLTREQLAAECGKRGFQFVVEEC